MRIDVWRAKVDTIDDQIVALLNLRISLVQEIVAQKTHEKLPLRDSQREQEILLRAHQFNDGPMDDCAVNKIFGLIISESRRIAIEAISIPAP